MTTDYCSQEEEDNMIAEVCCMKPIMMAAAQQHHDEVHLLSDYEILQLEHCRALEALRQLAEGVCIITRQMKQQHFSDDNDSVASGASDGTQPLRTRSYSSGTVVSVCSVLSEDDIRLNGLSQSLEGIVGADLLGLSQAAQMLNEHARLASHEASILTDDITIATRTVDSALERSIKAEKAVMRLYRENINLQNQLDNLMIERKVLAREIKSMRKENITLKQFQQDCKRQEMMLALEQHVRGALIVHEQQLATANRNKQIEFQDQTEEAAAAAAAAAEKADTAPEETQPNQSTKLPETQTEPRSVNEVDDASNKMARELDNVATSKKQEQPKPATHSLGFGGAGLAGYGYKFNRPKQPLQLFKKSSEAKTFVETPTAATVATEKSTPTNNAPDDTISVTSDKENSRKEPNALLSSSKRKIIGDLSMASSTFTSFFSSRSAKVAITAPRRQCLDLQSITAEAAQSTALLTVNTTQVPPSVTMHHATPTLLSPFAEDSPVAAAASRHVDFVVAKCDEQVLRSLSLPQEESPVDDDALSFPRPRSDGLFEA